MDPREIEPMLTRHRRRRFRPWKCRCGLRYPCGAREVALTERRRLITRAVTEAYPRYFASGSRAELAALARLRDPGHWSP